MDSTDMELECDGSCETSKIVRNEDTDAKRKTIDVDLDSYGREDVPNPPKIRKNVKQSIVWDHFERLKGDPNDPRAKCKYCGIVYACHSKRNGTGTMKHHLENCKKYPYQKKRDQTQMTLAFKPKDKVGDNSSQLVCDTIGKTIEKNLKDWGIERVMTLTVDNASSNDTAVAYLLKRFNKGLLFGGEFLHVHCCAHILNLIVTDAFKEHNDCIDRIRYAVRFIRRLFHEYSTTRSGSRQGCSSTSTTSTQTVSGLDANIDFDSNENVGEDFVYDTIVEEFEDDVTTPFEEGSSKIDIYLLEANVRTECDFDILQWWKMNSD
ncbi:zinc finger BED domain-containing protein RICESLEEPER 3-like [Cucumis melo var. makuwa]|uniref:Zinc finger BED domain-containing protein RICESLEEPER 3-like n=1 Tax=Cucumis melo var. makuwa TaxID=1194695 RepID=A0A5A7TWZ3_CUCMM|nr:zinc finger BED domain-containing protein RICESLEEPER 3-like [Cucumis melo var. makuwa]